MLLSKINSESTMVNTDVAERKGKTISEFSKEEWEKLISKVDNAIETYKKDLEEREEEALEKQKKNAESNILSRQMKENYEYEQNVMMGGAMQAMRFQKLNSGMFSEENATKTEKPDIEDSISDFISEEAIQQIVGNRGKIPYSVLADENGMIEYNGVTFVSDFSSNSLCLGDMSEPNKVLTVQLSDGGYLRVNLDSLDDLSKAIGMFSPEDQNRIMRAIAQHNRIKQIEQQIEDETSGLKVLEKNEDVAFYA